MSTDEQQIVVPEEVRSSFEVALGATWARCRAFTPVSGFFPSAIGLFCQDDECGARVTLTPDQAEALGTWLVTTAARVRKAAPPPEDL